MLDIFYYIKTEQLKDILNLGIKLSENFERTVSNQTYLCGLLNPKDNLEYYYSKEYICIQLNIDTENLRIADKSLFNSMYYTNSLIPFNEYILGSYLQPEVLIPISILPEKILEYNYSIGAPILYDNSRELYYNNLISKLSLDIPNYNSIICDALLKEHTKNNNLKYVSENDVNIYIDEQNRKTYTTEK